MKRGILVLGIFVLLVLSIGYASATGERISAQNFSGNQTIKVIVKLNSQNTVIRGIGISEIKNRISIVNNLSREYNINKVYTSTNYISLEVNSTQFEELSLRKDITSIKKEYELHTMLQQSTSIINSSLTGNLQINGLNLTGYGQTVCIIDTGINYSHNDLGGCTTSQFLAGNCNKVLSGIDFVNTDLDPYDDNGHGTHVAGIISANGETRGVAPDSKLVIAKACNSNGGCSIPNIAQAIDWCVGNSSNYNISVISISAGDPAHRYNTTSECENYDAGDIGLPVSRAIAKNISVVIASGNDNDPTTIDYPSCLTNVTSVGATNKDDSIASYSDRAAIMKLLAPGSSINSTWLNGGYAIDSGTSMATPHVSGAIAVIKQLLTYLNTPKTTSQIESIFNNTGRTITDSTNVSYSRINVYAAVMSLDTIAPSINLVSPTSNYITSNSSVLFIANTSDWALSNLTFQLKNSSGTIINTSYFSITGTVNSSNITINNISPGIYNWTFFSYDNKSNLNSSTYQITIDSSPPILSFGTRSEINNSFVNRDNIIFNVSSYGANLANITSFLYNSSYVLMNKTIVYGAVSYSNYFNLSDGEYYFNASANNTLGNASYGGTYKVTIDTLSPNVNLTNPIDNYTATTNSISLEFNFTINDTNSVSNCSIMSNNVPKTNVSIQNQSAIQNISATFAPGNYNASISCTDVSGNIGNSSYRQIIISSPAQQISTTSSSGGGGGGGGGITAIIPSTKQLDEGYTQEIKAQQIIQFTIGDVKTGKHTLTINKITNTSVDITIRSDPINLTLNIGQSVKINISSSEYFDFYVKLESINNGKANLTVETIHELINSHIINNNIKNISNTVNNITLPIDNNSEKKNVSFIEKIISYKWEIILALAIIVLTVFSHNLFKRRKIRENKYNLH